MRKKTLRDLPDSAICSRRVLVRLDLNVPVDESGRVTDDTRIVASLPTLEYILSRGGRPVVLSHFGRPKGEPRQKYSLQPVADVLQARSGHHVVFCETTDTDEAIKSTHELRDGDILLLENTRFLPGEERNDDALARTFGELGDIFVNDAFGAAHRAHASTAGVAKYVHPSVAGLLMQRELEFMGGALADPVHPFVAVLGGSKVSGKIDVIRALLPKVDALLIGGAMACTFFKAMGYEVGQSLVEQDRVDLARELIETSGTRLTLPHDAVVAGSIDDKATLQVVKRDVIPADKAMYDIGPSTAQSYSRAILAAKTVIWNGPMGVFEKPPFDAGTLLIARAMAEATAKGATTIVGGGDSAAAIAGSEFEGRMSHVSTGGGASLEFLEGKKLPGVEALDDA
ncbi:MAG: phosphoglycerate kinase [Gemmatimonadota bacterium]|nr:phosphoglycerate kinase [Gemmatimonadota bacterium]